jgi:hypothetical protein
MAKRCKLRIVAAAAVMSSLEVTSAAFVASSRPVIDQAASASCSAASPVVAAGKTQRILSGILLSEQQQQQADNSQQQADSQQQQQQQPWWNPSLNQLINRPAAEVAGDWRSAAMAVLTAATMLGGNVQYAVAENELVALANSKSTAEIVKPECFAQSCKSQVEACAADGDCMKGLACTAKCMGDAQCTVGCFARYNDANLERVMSCTIEDAGCIAIATQAPGPDTAFDAPLPPKALIRASPASLEGKWYKVMGFNPNYDCFECQRNSFTAQQPSEGGAAQVSSVKSVDVKPSTASVLVEYAMPRERIGQKTEVYRSTLNEKLEFDTEPGSRRTAHTEGKMFGLTFWENWYLIGENKPKETEFKFVYYTGKTLQNRYEGAFVYARKPELPANALPSIYKIAREAGFEPTKACCIDNSCFEAPVEAANKPLFTPVAEAGTLPEAVAAPVQQQSSGIAAPSWLRDVTELLEDPKPPAERLFARQRTMTEVREFDSNGYRRSALR